MADATGPMHLILVLVGLDEGLAVASKGPPEGCQLCSGVLGVVAVLGVVCQIVFGAGYQVYSALLSTPDTRGTPSGLHQLKGD